MSEIKIVRDNSVFTAINKLFEAYRCLEKLNNSGYPQNSYSSESELINETMKSLTDKGMELGVSYYESESDINSVTASEYYINDDVFVAVKMKTFDDRYSLYSGYVSGYDYKLLPTHRENEYCAKRYIRYKYTLAGHTFEKEAVVGDPINSYVFKSKEAAIEYFKSKGIQLDY